MALLRRSRPLRMTQTILIATIIMGAILVGLIEDFRKP